MREPSDELFHRASHDLTAPLRDIALLAEWIEQDAAPSLSLECLESLQLMRARITRLRSALADLLVYCRAPQTVREISRVDSGNLVRQLLVQLAVPESFALVLSSALPVIETSQTALREVFRQLLRNVVQHHDRGGGTIEIQWRQQDNSIEWCVSDDGPGISEAGRAVILKMFIALKGVDDNLGSGVGLAVANRFVELNGGQISIEPNEPRGTRFRFSWPLSALAITSVG